MTLRGVEAYRNLLERHGRPLHSVGSAEMGLSRGHALQAIECLRASRIAILGGDVYRFVGDRLEPTLDNWYCERRDGEMIADFQQRSLDLAARYVSDYPDPGEGIVFSLVVE